VFVHHLRIYFAVVVFPRNTFAAAGKAYGGAVKAAVVVLERCAVAAGSFGLAIRAGIFPVQVLNTKAKAVGGHGHTAAQLYMVAAGKVQLFIVAPPGN